MASPHQNKTLAWPNALPWQAQHTKSGSPHKKQISLDKLLEHTSECQSLDKIREKRDKGIKPLPFLMSTVAFFMRARSDPIKYHYWLLSSLMLPS